MTDETEAQRTARQDREAAQTYRRNRAIRTKHSRAKDEQEDWELRTKAKRELEAKKAEDAKPATTGTEE